MKIDKTIGIVSLLALIPVLPYTVLGYSGHDFQFHAASWMDLRNAWAGGRWTPGWAEKAEFTLGDPHFCFYPPISFSAGALLTLLLTLQASPAAFVWLTFFTSGMAMYIASKPFVPAEHRLWAALLYMFGPYALIVSVVRFAAGEMLVQAWLPLILLWLYGAIWKKQTRAMVLLGCLLGLSWLTNIPASLVILYGLLAVTAFWSLEQRSAESILRLMLAELLAGMLAAFYLVPVWLEQKWISVGNLGWTDTRQFLLFMSHIDSGQSFDIATCWVIAVLEVLMIAWCLWKRSKRFEDNHAVRSWTYLALVSFFFQLPLSLFLWQHLPELRLVQFPFRFLPLSGAALPLILLAEGTRPALRKQVVALVGLMTFLILGGHSLKQYKISQHSPRLSELESRWGQDGYQGVPEYVPAGTPFMTAAALAPGVVRNTTPQSGCKVSGETRGYDTRKFMTDSEGICRVRLATLFYPYWFAVDETGKSLPATEGADGLLLVTAPAGKHTVRVEFRPVSAARTAWRAVSLVSALLVAPGLAFSLCSPKLR